MMMNIDKITSMLRRLEPVNRPEAVQQYAQQHKDNYIIMSLAMQEANRRKAALAAQNLNAPPAPKVNDQVLQGMAAPMPESVGIGQLPAGDMNFADGGIIAFSDGGVPRYKDEGLVRLPGETADDYRLRLARMKGERQRPVVNPQRLAEAEGLMIPSFGAGAVPAAATSTVAVPSAAERLSAGDLALRQQPIAIPPSAAAAPKADTGAAGARGPGQRVPPAGGPELLGDPGAGAPASSQSIYSLASTPSTYQREFEQFLPQGKVADPFEADVREQGAAEEKVARDYAAKRKAQLEGMGLLGLEQEKRLKAREEKLGKQEGELGPLALLQAGFAMMSGASPNALQNIGVGAQAGLKKYGEGIERLDAAREKIDDAFGRLEIARRSEKMLTDKELAEIERDADKIPAQTRREVINSARTAYGLSATQAGKMFDAYVADKRLGAELGSRERLSREQMQNQLASAKISAGAQQNFYEALGKAAPDSPLAKGFASAKEADKIPRLYGEYTKLVADPMNGSAFEQKYPTFEAFLSAMSGSRSAGFVTPPKNAPVLRAPGT